MKASLSWLITLVPLLAAIAAGCAHERDTTESYNGTALTGSYIPQNVQRSGPVTNGKNDVQVLDRTDIQNSGGADVRQSLQQLGVTH